MPNTPRSTVIYSKEYETHYNYDPDYLYEYENSSDNNTTSSSSTLPSVNSAAAIMNDFMGFQFYENEEGEDVEGNFY